GMYGGIVTPYIVCEQAVEFLKGMYFRGIQRREPAAAHGPEVALHLLSECSDKRFYTTFFIIRIFSEDSQYISDVLKKDADNKSRL
ncbi:MAG: hypothetical protein J6Y90_02960, partial [Lachnospiraceae bacterium]|nr:hypothetical protein [Lachnospiraceae bacterium]